MTPKAKLGMAALVAAPLAWFAWQHHDAQEAERLRQSQAQAAAQQQAGLSTGLSDLFSTPTNTGAPRDLNSDAGSQAWLQAGRSLGDGDNDSHASPIVLEETPEQKAQSAELKRLGYHIHERYYLMPLMKLRQTASAGDVQALTHLAERYLFFLDGKPQEPEFEQGFAYRDAAREALKQAYLGGNLHAAAIISESFLLDKRPLDAAAWNLIAERVGDKLSTDWFRDTQDYRQLTEAQKAEARRLADNLWNDLQSRKAAKG